MSDASLALGGAITQVTNMKSMSIRLAAYAVCLEREHILLVRQVSGIWSLPGGKVEHGEDPIDAVVREVAEETGRNAIIERLLGVDSRVISSSERTRPGGPALHNVGIFYLAKLTRGELRPEANGETAGPRWVALTDVAALVRSSLVEIGLALARTNPANGHTQPVRVGGLIQH